MQSLYKIISDVQHGTLYSLTMFILAVFSVSLLIYEYLVDLPDSYVALILNIDLTIAYIFLIDFLVGVIAIGTGNRYKYMRKNWLNFISSIPISNDITRILRILRIVRALRIINAGTNVWTYSRALKKD